MAQASTIAASASAAKEDPMDLGPFLKEYVLNNPFTPSPPPPSRPVVLAPRPLPVVAVKSQPLLAPNTSRHAFGPGNNSRVSSPACVTTTTLSHVPVLAVKAITSPIVQQVAPIVHQPVQPQINPMALRLANGGGIRTEGHQGLSPIIGLASPAIVDTPKAHIGSNRNFAAMLREAKLPHKHSKVQKWLQIHYRHVPTNPNWLSSEDLLDHAHHLFTDLKSNILTRIMKATFPNCHKIVNKYGYFYIGLVRRPEKEHYEDAVLRMAAEAISTGSMTSDVASQVHGVSSDVLKRMLVWIDTINDPVPEVKPVMTETDSESDEVLPNQDTPRANLKWKLREKARSRLLTKRKVADDRDSSPDRNWTPSTQYRTTPYKRRRKSLGRGRPKTAKSSDGLHVKEEQQVSESDDDTRMDCEDVSSEASLPVISAIGSMQVRVKSEPVDPDYACYEQNDNNNNDSPNGQDGEDVKESFHTLRNLLNEKPEGLNLVLKDSGESVDQDSSSKQNSVQEVTPTNTNSSNSSTRTQSLNSVVDLLTMKQELQRTREDLNEKQNTNSKLEKKLEEAHAEIVQLRETVSGQETQLFDLASEFFELSNRFMKMTHKFKQALSDAKSIRDQKI